MYDPNDPTTWPRPPVPDHVAASPNPSASGVEPEAPGSGPRRWLAGLGVVGVVVLAAAAFLIAQAVVDGRVSTSSPVTAFPASTAATATTTNASATTSRAVPRPEETSTAPTTAATATAPVTAPPATVPPTTAVASIPIDPFVGDWFSHASGLTITADGDIRMEIQIYGNGTDRDTTFPRLRLAITGSVGSTLIADVVETTEPTIAPIGTTLRFMPAAQGLDMTGPEGFGRPWCDPPHADAGDCGA
jgi:hypothetical protein